MMTEKERGRARSQQTRVLLSKVNPRPSEWEPHATVEIEGDFRRYRDEASLYGRVRLANGDFLIECATVLPREQATIYPINCHTRRAAATLH